MSCPKCGHASFDVQLEAALKAAREAVLARVKACPQCGERFLKVGKQKYCTSQCAKRAAWRAFVARGRHRDYHAEYLARREASA